MDDAHLPSPPGEAMKARLQRAHRFGGEATVPGDKSIAHRALILAAIATGTTRIEGLPDGADVRSTIACLRALGVGIDEGGVDAIVHGVGLHGLQRPAASIY